MNGGEIVAQVLVAQGVRFLFTLCGGHIAPILVGSQAAGLRVIDARHEATAVFAADAVARLTGRPGVATVTAGPGLTNTITAVKNAQLAQSPLVLIGGAAPTMLQDRGALQDIDQIALIRPHVKQALRVRHVRDITPALMAAFRISQEGVPGPVFVEYPIDLLYGEATVRELYGVDKMHGRTLADRAMRWYLGRHVNGLFAGATAPPAGVPAAVDRAEPAAGQVQRIAGRLLASQRPVLLVGSQAMLAAGRDGEAGRLADAVARIGAPVYLSGMARGLLGRDHPLQMHHNRRAALRETDLAILAGVPCDFRLDYGRQISRRATYVAANLSPRDLKRNRRPDIALPADPGLFLQRLAALMPAGERWPAWIGQLAGRDAERTREIAAQTREPLGKINPLYLLSEIAGRLPDNAIIVGDGGDFVGSASYIVQPPRPLTWLDPGVFGTLGVGAGFALGAKLCHPEAEVWVLYGDGSLGYSLAEFDTFVRHGVAVIAVVGNDAGWTQIAREQVPMLGNDVGTRLAHSDYHRVVDGFGGVGIALSDPEMAPEALDQARAAAAGGQPVLVNAIIGRTDFRKGSISM